MRLLITVCLWISVVFPAAAQDLDIRVLPDTIYVEELGGPIIPARRVFFHTIFHNSAAGPIEIQWVRFDLVGAAGAVVSGQFSGPALADLFDGSVQRRRIEPTAADSRVLGPDQRKAISDVFLTLPAEFVGNTLVVEAEYRNGESVSTNKISVPMVPAQGVVGRLPFEGIWYVAAGHDVLDVHRRFTAEAFAYDFLQIGVNGRSYVGQGTRNSDYYAYGQPVLAAADGEVVYMRNDIPENVPGQAMPATPGGNAVAIRHADNRYTYYAHLRPSGMKVGVGDQVSAGDPIGEVGNSGDSLEPHLHFQAMSGPDGSASPGIPVLFEGWISDAYGQRSVVRRLGVLPRGDFVAPP